MKSNFSLSQQQSPYSSQSMPDYQTVFNQRVVPVDLSKHAYINAQNVNFTENLNHVATDLILVDSMARNWDTETTSSYTNYLAQNFQYVHSLELVDGYVPTSGYVINGDNNMIYFQEEGNDSPVIAVAIPVGNYDIGELLECLKK